MFRREVVHIEITAKEVKFLWENSRLWQKSKDLLFQCIPYQSEKTTNTNMIDSAVIKQIVLDFKEKYIGNKRIDTYVYLPFQNGSIREIKLPWVEKKNRDDMICHYIEHEFPVPTGELVYDYHVIEEKEEGFLRVWASVIRKDTISSYMRCFSKTGYVLRAINYSINSTAETLKRLKYSKEQVICLRGLTDDHVQLVLYHQDFPEIICEISSAQSNLSHYQMSLLFKEYELPLAKVITDNTISAERIANNMLHSGLVKEKAHDLPGVEGFSSSLSDKGLPVYPLLGGVLQLERNGSINLYNPYLFHTKLRIMGMLVMVLFVLLISLGSLSWYSNLNQYFILENEIYALENNLSQLQDRKEPSSASKYKVNRNQSMSELEQLQNVLDHAQEGIMLTRMNLKQGNLYLWAECQDNAEIATLIGKLTAEGWHDPILANYRYHNGVISFSVTLKSKVVSGS